MKYLIVYAHPNQQSFNHAIRETIAEELGNNKREFRVRDLYKSGFNPVLGAEDFAEMQKGSVSPDVRAEQDYIRTADIIVFIYPLWWSGLPAILKGYIDRVFTEGFAYRITETGIEGLLKGKRIFLVTTTGASKKDYEESGSFESMGRVIDIGIFQLCGIDLIEHTYFSSVPYIADSDRKQMLDALRVTVREKLL